MGKIGRKMANGRLLFQALGLETKGTVIHRLRKQIETTEEREAKFINALKGTNDAMR